MNVDYFNFIFSQNNSSDDNIFAGQKKAYIGLGAFSMFCSFLVGLTYIFSKQIRAHPAQIVVMICFCECVAAYHLIIWSINPKQFVDFFGLATWMGCVDYGL